MKTNLIALVFILFVNNISTSQEWMTDLNIAQKLAFVQNKMVLMVWEASTKYPYPVLVNDSRNRSVLIDNLFVDEDLSPLIWKYFVPVIVNENQYEDLFKKIKGKRKTAYIDKFNDDSIKIMDVNGNILNMNIYDINSNYEDITILIRRYYIDTSMISQELVNYKAEKSFYSAYYLASRYLDLSLYSIERVRPEIVGLSNIYFNEALEFLKTFSKEEKLVLEQRCSLLKIQESLIFKQPKKVIRALKKIKTESIESANQSFVAFLYYASYMSLKDFDKAEVWKSNISLIDLRKAQMLINLNLK
ncbi:MAG: hypothetical protein NWP87_02920 [Winogradskyella sp.]|nr:hypothetical protein [Winogradskyella sp.]